MEIIARKFDSNRPVRLVVCGDRIASVTVLPRPRRDRADLPWIMPGLVDLQINGYRGQEFSSPELTERKVAEIVHSQAAFGVTRLCPTLTTNRRETLCHALATIDRACQGDAVLARRVAGIHLEGPYVSRQDGPRGAHPINCCRRPDWDEFRRLQDAAGGRIRILTMSVEFDGSAEFVRKVADSGVVVAIGHTAADSDQIQRAVDAGARMSTHLGNGSHPMLARHHNYLWDQLAEDRLVAGLIVDGHHLPPPVVKTFVRAKTPQRCILVSDLSGYAGLPPGTYETDLCKLETLPSGKMVVAGQTELLAGASAPLIAGVANVMHFAGVDLPTAVGMAVDRPAEMLGLPLVGLEEGRTADFVLFDWAPEVDPRGPRRILPRATVAQGQLLWGSV